MALPENDAPDPVAQSIEARRRQVMAKITEDIVATSEKRRRLTPEIDDPRDLALDRLSLEYGRSLFLDTDAHGVPRFRVSDPGAGNGVYILPPDEQEVLAQRLAILEEQVRASLAP